MKRIWTTVTVIALAAVAIFAGARLFAKAEHFSIQTEDFHESAKAVSNPGRGFYQIERVRIPDISDVPERRTYGPGETLTLAEINLEAYRDGDIGREGLEAVDAYLSSFDGLGKRAIVRFLYDWDGNGAESEPDCLDIIMRHMSQLGPVVKKHADAIFTMQGLFTGSWGEMHGTAYGSDADVRTLARTLFEATDGSAYLAVRTPAQWLAATEDGSDTELASKLGLYNDGMFGSETDLGTYTDGRDTGLRFQDAFCAFAPNGGEAVGNGPYSDFMNAVAELSTVHASYLNGSHDPVTLNKWASVTVSDGSVFDGLDGLSYIERRLGYRLWISEAEVSADFIRGRMKISVDIKNSGFAPLYSPMELVFTLRESVTGASYSAAAECALSGLTGGDDADRAWRTGLSVPLEWVESGIWTIYADFRDVPSGEPVLMANDTERSPYGYHIATVIGRPALEK